MILDEEAVMLKVLENMIEELVKDKEALFSINVDLEQENQRLRTTVDSLNNYIALLKQGYCVFYS